jgi:hypothetical protein
MVLVMVMQEAEPCERWSKDSWKQLKKSNGPSWNTGIFTAKRKFILLFLRVRRRREMKLKLKMMMIW